MTLSPGQPVPDALARARVLDSTGGEHVLGDAWSDRDALVVFARHFACAGCADHLAELRPRLGELAALGVGVVWIGNGTPVQLAAFVATQRLAGHPLALFTDPELAAYRAADLIRDRLGTVGPRAVANLVKLALRGHINGRTCGDLWQQGGTLFVKKGGELGFGHRGVRVGDHAPVSDVIHHALAARAIEVG